MLLPTFANILALLICVVSCTPLAVHETRRSAPAGFTSLGAAPDSNMLTLKFALASKNIPGLENKLSSISSPGSSEFRQWLSKDEVKAFVQPCNETVNAFKSFAFSNGLTPTSISSNGDWVSLTLPVATANKLFGADFQDFEHASLTQPITRTLSISLPAELVGHVEVIHPTTSFSTSGFAASRQISPSSRRRNLEEKRLIGERAESETGAEDCDGLDIPMTPACLQKLYGIPTTPATQQSNSLMVTGYLSISPNRTDLSTFLKDYRSDVPSNTTYELVQTGTEGVEPPPADAAVLQLEADLDIQYSLGLVTGVPVQFLSVKTPSTELDGFATALLETNMFLEGLDNPPSVVTTSYGPTETDFGESMTRRALTTFDTHYIHPYNRKICNSYLALTARGISVVYSAGDGGVRGSHDNPSVPGSCESNDFLVVFPASCPWVTAVGATQGIHPEIATNLTGGGFSNLFPRPWYQIDAAESYLKGLSADFPGHFNRSGRAYPDVAVQGGNLDFIYQGHTVHTGGTSFSSPIFASVIATINDRLVAAGKPVLGFLNPWIYANADAFTDITEGHNSGHDCPADSPAFDAAKGWDPLTGVGSPVFDKLLAAAFTN
ncbi:family S53 protease-like protein [Favolaschia claudopus]|uniref:tripeptidyl-peptidase II n=1 Tax=Favolaschia claudopus TaxID=2862362 RepID=A0AAW0BQW2_9AGAR